MRREIDLQDRWRAAHHYRNTAAATLQPYGLLGHRGGCRYDLFCHDPIDVLRELLANPTLQEMTWEAEKCTTVHVARGRR